MACSARWRSIALFLLLPRLAAGYSVLTHEAVIDSAWEAYLKPSLLKRFPGSTPAQLLEAHAYAYGGAIIQDLGYYPGGSHLFSDLTHYIRSGAFCANLIRQAGTLDEYAFSLGALAHYAGDSDGHSRAVNIAEPLIYARIARKFGPVVTYEEEPVLHVKTEFSFDVLQVARGFYAPQAYHDFIGFAVAEGLLDRGFAATYCIHLNDVFPDATRSLNTFRHTVSGLIPEATKVAWAMKGDSILKQSPGMNRRRFTFHISRASYRREWGDKYEKPGFFARLLAFILKLVPKVGPLRDLAFRIPTPQAELLFQGSFDATLDRYRQLIQQASSGSPLIPDLNLDTAQPYRPGDYRLADQALSELNQIKAMHATSCPDLPVSQSPTL